MSMTPEEMLNTAKEDNKPTISTARVVKPAIKVEQSKSKNESTALIQFNQLADTWLKGWENKNKQIVAKTFKSMINHVLKYQDDKSVLDAWRKLFIKYRDTYLSPEQAMVGIPNMTESESNKMALTYTLMSELVNPHRTRTTFDMQYAASVLRNPKCRIPNGYIAYISERLR